MDGKSCTLAMDKDRKVTAHFALLAPVAAVDPLEVAFDTLFVGQQSPPQTVTVTNQGDAPLHVASAALAGPDAADFGIQQSTCSPLFPLSPGDGCTFQVLYAPLTAGQKSAQVEVLSDDPLSPSATVVLVATAEEAPRSVTITVHPEEGGAVTGSGFDCPGTCWQDWPGPVDLVLTAKPAGDWHHVAWLGCDSTDKEQCSLSPTAGDHTVSVFFSRHSPKVGVDPELLLAGEVEVGKTSAPVQTTITNLGQAALELGPATVSGVGAKVFALSGDGCSGQSLEPGGKCTIAVAFSPDATGSTGATLRLPCSDPFIPEVEIGLHGTGIVPEAPPPETKLPQMEITPSNLDFGEVTVGQASAEQTFVVKNNSGPPLVIMNLAISGEEATDFAISTTDCTTVEAGQSCNVTLVFLPAKAGARTAALLVSHNALYQVTSLSLTGTGVGGGGGGEGGGACGVGRGRGTPVWPLLVLLMCLLIRHLQPGWRRLFLLRWGEVSRASTASTGRWGATRYLSALLPLLLLVSCSVDALAPCKGDGELTGTGTFEVANKLSSKICSAASWSCQEMQLLCNQDVDPEAFATEEYAALEFFLQPPIFPGRVYGKGTEILMHWPGMLFPVSYYVTSGQVTVTDVLVYEAARACTNEISLDIDVEAWWANGGMPGYEALTQGNGTLKGWLTFSYGDTGENITVTGRDDVVWEDCLPPQLEDPQSFWAAKTGQHVFENAPYPQDVFDGEVRYWGTAENQVDLEVWDIIRDAPEQWALWRRSVVRIVPPTIGPGNFICGLVDALNADQICDPGKPPEPFAVQDDTGPVFIDRYGLRPAIVPDWEGKWKTGAAPLITSPAVDQVLYEQEPIVIEWGPPEPTSPTATVRLIHSAATEDDGELVAELAVPDNGHVVLDPSLLGEWRGAIAVEVERTYTVENPYGFPVSPESRLTQHKAHRISTMVRPGAAIHFGDPAEVAAGWSAQVQIGSLLPEALAGTGQVVAAAADNTLHVAWIDSPSQGDYKTVLRTLDVNAMTWSDDRLVSIPHPIQLGPLGISAIPGKVMVWGYTSSRPDGYHPVANVLPAAGLPIMLTPEVGGQEKAWGYAGLLLADGRALLAMTTLIGEQSGNPLTGLYYSLDGGPMQPLVESGTVAWAAAWAFQSAAGEVSVFYYDDYHQTLWVGQAGETLDGDVTTVDSWITGHYCNAGTADGTNAHLLGQADAMAGEDGCYYGRVPLAGGAMNITEQVPLAQTWFISDRWEATAIATASDGTVWALWGLSCDQGRCTVLARRTPDGTWYGPYLPSHVTGAAAMAVDAAGRVHLVYSPVPVEGNRDLAPVYHTMLEVVQ